MKYRDGYKYQLAEDFSMMIPIHPVENIITQYICLSTKGYLTISSGYAYDGPSGPTIDRPKQHVLVGALVHDALYQLLRLGLLPKKLRREVDRLAYQIWLNSGMWKWRAKIWLKGLRRFASFAADPKNVKKVYEVS